MPINLSRVVFEMAPKCKQRTDGKAEPCPVRCVAGRTGDRFQVRSQEEAGCAPGASNQVQSHQESWGLSDAETVPVPGIEGWRVVPFPDTFLREEREKERNPQTDSSRRKQGETGQARRAERQVVMDTAAAGSRGHSQGSHAQHE